MVNSISLTIKRRYNKIHPTPADIQQADALHKCCTTQEYMCADSYDYSPNTTSTKTSMVCARLSYSDSEW